jgi:uncharacterized protein (DUF1778 family)
MKDASNIILNDRIAVSVTSELRKSVERVADAQNLTVSDFVRSAVSDRLDLLDVPHKRIPHLRRRPF